MSMNQPKPSIEDFIGTHRKRFEEFVSEHHKDIQRYVWLDIVKVAKKMKDDPPSWLNLFRYNYMAILLSIVNHAVCCGWSFTHAPIIPQPRACTTDVSDSTSRYSDVDLMKLVKSTPFSGPIFDEIGASMAATYSVGFFDGSATMESDIDVTMVIMLSADNEQIDAYELILELHDVLLGKRSGWMFGVDRTIQEMLDANVYGAGFQFDREYIPLTLRVDVNTAKVEPPKLDASSCPIRRRQKNTRTTTTTTTTTTTRRKFSKFEQCATDRTPMYVVKLEPTDVTRAFSMLRACKHYGNHDKFPLETRLKCANLLCAELTRLNIICPRGPYDSSSCVDALIDNVDVQDPVAYMHCRRILLDKLRELELSTSDSKELDALDICTLISYITYTAEDQYYTASTYRDIVCRDTENLSPSQLLESAWENFGFLCRYARQNENSPKACKYANRVCATLLTCISSRVRQLSSPGVVHRLTDDIGKLGQTASRAQTQRRNQMLSDRRRPTADAAYQNGTTSFREQMQFGSNHISTVEQLSARTCSAVDRVFDFIRKTEDLIMMMRNG